MDAHLRQRVWTQIWAHSKTGFQLFEPISMSYPEKASILPQIYHKDTTFSLKMREKKDKRV